MSRHEAEPGHSDSGPRTLVAALGSPAREVLWGLVEHAQAPDPLAPVTVAVPSPYVGLALRRELGRRRGLVNVRFVALARVAELLGAPVLAASGRAPLTTARRVEAVHAVLAADPGRFVAVADQRGTEVRLAATFADLRRAGPGAVETLAVRGARAAGVVALYRRYLDVARDGCDEEDLAGVAPARSTRAGLDELRTSSSTCSATLRCRGPPHVGIPPDHGRAVVVVMPAKRTRPPAPRRVSSLRRPGGRGPRCAAPPARAR